MGNGTSGSRRDLPDIMHSQPSYVSMIPSFSERHGLLLPSGIPYLPQTHFFSMDIAIHSFVAHKIRASPEISPHQSIDSDDIGITSLGPHSRSPTMSIFLENVTEFIAPSKKPTWDNRSSSEASGNLKGWRDPKVSEEVIHPSRDAIHPSCSMESDHYIQSKGRMNSTLEPLHSPDHPQRRRKDYTAESVSPNILESRMPHESRHSPQHEAVEVLESAPLSPGLYKNSSFRESPNPEQVINWSPGFTQYGWSMQPSFSFQASIFPRPPARPTPYEVNLAERTFKPSFSLELPLRSFIPRH